MSASNSKIPDFSEVVGMATKLFKDVQKSVCEIADDYKAKRKEAAKATESCTVNVVKETVKETSTESKTAEVNVETDVKKESE